MNDSATTRGGCAVGLKNLHKSYGSMEAVRGIDLEIMEGEFFALLGPSGCGKTTTLKLIAGFEQPTVGDVTVLGESVDGVPAHQRDVNTVFQNFALFPHLDIRDNVAFGLRMKGVGRAERRRMAEEALERVELANAGRRQIDELSGGQQQRVALARALVNEPSVLLLDEPLGALDLKLRRNMQAKLKEIQRSVGISFIFVTHDQHEALAMADRIAVMNDGLVQQVGTPQEIYEEPSSRFVAQFIGESGFLSGTVESNDGFASVALPNGDRIKAKGADAKPGRKVTLAIRPEHVEFGSIADPGTNAVTGIVRSAEYIGSDSYFTIEVGASGTLIVRQTGASQPIGIGSETTVVFPVEKTVVLADEVEERPSPATVTHQTGEANA